MGTEKGEKEKERMKMMRTAGKEEEPAHDAIKLRCYVCVSICWICFWALFWCVSAPPSPLPPSLLFSYTSNIHLPVCTHVHTHTRISIHAAAATITTHTPPIKALCQHVHSDSNRSVYFLRLKCIYWFYRWLEPDECSMLVVCIYSLNEWLSLSHTPIAFTSHMYTCCTVSFGSVRYDGMCHQKCSTAVRFYWILNTRFHLSLSLLL